MADIGDKHYEIVRHYELCLKKYGDTHKGVDWPRVEDVPVRYKVMLEVIREKNTPVSLLDFGCGASHMYEYMVKHQLSHIQYTGLDISDKYIALSQKKYPHNKYYCLDVLKEPDKMFSCDYAILNGVFTEKCSLTFEEMVSYLEKIVTLVFANVKKGMAFNVMSKHVEWERDDLFHMPFDTLASFLTKNVSRNFIFRNDYGLYEYTAYVYR